MAGALTVGRPRKRKPDDQIKTLLSIKGKPEWIEWLREYADSMGIQASTAIDIALREQAKRDGFSKPMPKRF